MRASIENDQTGQVEIDLSNSQIDLNSNIQLTYPETSVTSFTENTSDNYFTENNASGSGSSCHDPQCRQYGECLTHPHPENDTTGNENDDTGTGNDITGTKAGNYRELGEEIVAQVLAEVNADSFALIRSDGSAYFRGSAPDSSYDLSAIEPYEGADDTNEYTLESYDDYAGTEETYEMDFPLRFEKGQQQ